MEWISVNDRLPNDSKTVLIAHRQWITTGWYSYAWVGGHGKSHTLRTVTHWMPLPEPPKEEK